MAQLGEAFANWRCECGRHASIDHRVNGYCYAGDKIKEMAKQIEILKAQRCDGEVILVNNIGTHYIIIDSKLSEQPTKITVIGKDTQWVIKT